MKELISGYLWGYKNIEAGDKSFEKFRKIYPNSDLFCRVDIDGDIDGYTKISEKYNAKLSINSIKVGYCGNFSASNHDVGRDGWPKENAFEWLNGIYSACLKTSAKYMIILEEDVFVLKPITILDKEFGAATVRTNNIIPTSIMQFIKSLGGNTTDDKYGCCGGCIINVEDFIRGWEFCKDELWDNYDIIFKQTKLIGWSDCILQIVIQCSGTKIIVNEQLVEPWMVEQGWIDKDWKEFEIVNYLKDIEIIKSL
jgi:hypothetical protein